MKITALRASQRQKNRVRVYLDGRFALSVVAIEAARLRVGQELDEAALGRLKQADAVEQAYEKALRFLSVRPRSEAEVRRRLREHDVPEADTQAVLERLRRAGLVDDKAFADYWVENRGAFRPKSRRALQAELRRKGVSGEALGSALGAAADADSAYRLARQRAERLKALSYQDFRRKLGEYLARRGYDYETAGPIVERVWKEARAGASDGAA